MCEEVETELATATKNNRPTLSYMYVCTLLDNVIKAGDSSPGEQNTHPHLAADAGNDVFFECKEKVKEDLTTHIKVKKEEK